ncbi:hypothetical protein HYV91_01895 [Candidatus Wolfebacteria bacterium]|nr:hypothetical protein [Candidatus Wolfebacteria bacterium]
MATNTDKTSGIDREKIREETRALAFDEIDRLAAEEVSISKTKRIGGEGVVLDREKIREEVRDEAFGQIDRLAAEIPVSAEPSPASRIPEKWEDLPADLQKLKDEVLPLFRKYYAGTMIEVIQGREEVNKLGIRTGDLYSTASERSDRIQDELRQHFESLDPQTPNQIYVERLMNRLNDQAIEEAESETGLSWVEAQRMLNERERKREEAGRRRMPSPEPPRVPEPASPPSGPEPPAQPVPPPRREPTPEKTSEEAWNVLKEARTAYAEAYRKHQHSHKERLGFLRKIIFEIKGGEYPGDDFLAQVKAKYDEAKLVYGQALRREGVEAGQIFKEVIIAEKLSLQKEQIETLPPKEKNLLGKAWDLWNRQSRYTKVGVSVFIATGAFASAPLVMAGATGFTSISAALLFAGQRFIRAAAISSPIVAGFFERTGEFFFSEGKTQDRKEQAISRLQSKFSLDAIGAADEEYGQILREEARRQKMKFAVKAGGLVVAGSGLGLLTYYHGGGLVGRGGIRWSENIDAWR